jgi:putative addiction module component (TIGR02574 family)
MLAQEVVNLKELTDTEKILLAQDLWDEVVRTHPEIVELTVDQQIELRKRREKYRGNTTDGLVVEDIEARFKAGR